MKTDYNRNLCSYYCVNNKNTFWWVCRHHRQVLSLAAKMSGSLHPTRTAEVAGASAAVVSQAMFEHATFACSYLTDCIHLNDTLNHWNWDTIYKKSKLPSLDSFFFLPAGTITPDLKWMRRFFTQTLCNRCTVYPCQSSNGHWPDVCQLMWNTGNVKMGAFSVLPCASLLWPTRRLTL